MDVERIAELRNLAQAATPGPWGWRGYADRGGLRLTSLTSMWPCVMAFERKGMQGAQPAFWKREPGEPRRAEYAPADQIAVLEVPYRKDVVDLDNADARYMAAASPDVVLALLDEIERLRDGNETLGSIVAAFSLDEDDA